MAVVEPGDAETLDMIGGLLSMVMEVFVVSFVLLALSDALKLR